MVYVCRGAVGRYLHHPERAKYEPSLETANSENRLLAMDVSFGRPCSPAIKVMLFAARTGEGGLMTEDVCVSHTFRRRRSLGGGGNLACKARSEWSDDGDWRSHLQ